MGATGSASKQGDLANIGIGVMRGNARVDVARRIHAHTAPSASNAATHKFAVILEIKRKQGFLLTHFSVQSDTDAHAVRG